MLQFTLPDGWQCLGTILERVEGPTLAEYLPSNRDLDHQIALVRISCPTVCTELTVSR